MFGLAGWAKQSVLGHNYSLGHFSYFFTKFLPFQKETFYPKRDNFLKVCVSVLCFLLYKVSVA